MIRVKNENEDIIVLDSNYSIESSDLHNIAESTHVVNISPIAVSAQEILSFTRVDGSTYISIYLSLLQHLCDHTAVSIIVVKL